jgi:hypothetical protein
MAQDVQCYVPRSNQQKTKYCRQRIDGSYTAWSTLPRLLNQPVLVRVMREILVTFLLHHIVSPTQHLQTPGITSSLQP